MKLLIFGLDGGDLEVLKVFKEEMPFIWNFIKNNKIIELEEDLLNRGWVEILTGKEGPDTRGFYMSPTLNSAEFSTNFRISELKGTPEVETLWDVCSRYNIKCGIMNVPTTTPAPQDIDGFIIGSAGGGLYTIDGIPNSLLSDYSFKDYLIKKEYVTDIRIPNTEIQTTQELFDQLLEMELKRTKIFVELAKSNKIDLGFLVNRGNAIVLYLARREIEYLSKDPNYTNWVVERLKEHFKNLDSIFQSLYEQLNPEHIIITSDHGIVPAKYRANINVFLQKNNYLYTNNTFRHLKKIKAFIKNFFNINVNHLPPTIINKARTINRYNMIETKAFGSTYIPGIFINDKVRFGGPVATENDINLITDEIVSKFNILPLETRLGMEAVPYRKKFKGSKFYDYLPDIKLENSEGIFFDTNGTSLVWENPNYGPIPADLKKVSHAAFTGDKGKKPLCIIDQDAADFVKKSDLNNLTLIYHLSKRLISHDKYD